MDTFPERFPGIDFAGQREDAVNALNRVLLEEISELKELWSENEEYYPLWQKSVEDVINRLKK